MENHLKVIVGHSPFHALAYVPFQSFAKCRTKGVIKEKVCVYVYGGQKSANLS